MKVFLFKGLNPYIRDVMARQLLGIEKNNESYTVTGHQENWAAPIEWTVIKYGDTDKSQYLQLGRERSDETIIVTGYPGLSSVPEESTSEQLDAEASNSEASDSEELDDFETLNSKNKSALVFSPTFVTREKKQEELINNIILYEEDSPGFNSFFEELKKSIRNENFHISNKDQKLTPTIMGGGVVHLSALNIFIDQEQRQLFAEQLHNVMSCGLWQQPTEPVLNSLVSCINYFLQELTLTKKMDIPFVWFRPYAKQVPQSGYLINVQQRYKTAITKFLSEINVGHDDLVSYYAPVGDCAVPMLQSQRLSGVFNIKPRQLATALAKIFDISLSNSQLAKSPISPVKKVML